MSDSVRNLIVIPTASWAPTSWTSSDLMDKLRAQAERFRAELITNGVTSVDPTGETTPAVRPLPPLAPTARSVSY